MRKAHLTLLVITAVMALLSVYSLAAINQVYRINFDWYSQYNNNYSTEPRETYKDRWLLDAYPSDMKFGIIRDNDEANLLKKSYLWKLNAIGTDFKNYVLLYCILGNVNSPEYRVKITDIAQRGNIVEIRVSLNSVAAISKKKIDQNGEYFIWDAVRIDKDAFPVKGKLCFIFKNQYGKQIYEGYYDIK